MEFLSCGDAEREKINQRGHRDGEGETTDFTDEHGWPSILIVIVIVILILILIEWLGERESALGRAN